VLVRALGLVGGDGTVQARQSSVCLVEEHDLFEHVVKAVVLGESDEMGAGDLVCFLLCGI
jgi:hypothetical protein